MCLGATSTIALILGNSRTFMTPALNKDHIVQALVEARRSGEPWKPGQFDESLGLEDAYAIQADVAQALGLFEGRPTAWKVGGLPVPNAAPLPNLLTDPAVWPMAGPEGVIIEAELAFRLTRTPVSAQDVLGCLGSVCVAIEIIGTRLVGGLAAPLAWKLLDQGVNAALVIGAERPFTTDRLSDSLDWSRQRCQMQVNAQVVAQATGSHPTGDPLSALPWLFEHAARHTGGLRAGDWVTTGAWLVQKVHAGDTVDVEFEGFGTARLVIARTMPAR